VEGALGRGHIALNENQQTRFEPTIEILGLQPAGFEVAHAAQAPGQYAGQYYVGH
jgi:hypothetical protein